MPLPKILVLLLLLFFVSCSEKSYKDFPVVRKLSAYQKTDFTPTLEQRLPKEKNFIYCSSLLYAWDEIRTAIKTPLVVDSAFSDLYLVNRAKSFAGTLRQYEYSSKAEVDGDIITARAEFKKSLPFEFPLKSFDRELVFFGEKVASFGLHGTDYNMLRTVRIRHYDNDNNFIITLLPKDSEHEIILAMTSASFTSLSDAVNDVTSKMKTGEAEKNEYRSTNFKFEFNDEDELVIPKLQFNIETHYATLEGKTFRSATAKYTIGEASQRTAFVLNEKGARVETEAEVAVFADSTGAVPKKMRFDKPFFVMLKRVESQYPYFAAWIANSELMIKE
jgi:hypothetical protein